MGSEGDRGSIARRIRWGCQGHGKRGLGDGQRRGCAGGVVIRIPLVCDPDCVSARHIRGETAICSCARVDGRRSPRITAVDRPSDHAGRAAADRCRTGAPGSVRDRIRGARDCQRRRSVCDRLINRRRRCRIHIRVGGHGGRHHMSPNCQRRDTSSRDPAAGGTGSSGR